jgi:hypothetical protein
MKVRRYYVGLNVGSTEPEGQRSKTIDAFSSCCPSGMTVQDVLGMWRGESERTLIFTVAGEMLGPFPSVAEGDDLIGDLCEYLEQQSIAVEEDGTMHFIDAEGVRS